MKQPVENKIAKTPVIMQMEALECGAACLAMILAYYDKWIPLEQVRVDCGVSRNGSKASSVVAAARNYGLDSKAYKLEPEILRKQGQFPCIIHWNFNHFVVLKGFKGDYAYINDPARGDVKIHFDEFDEAFTGIAIFFEPTDSFCPSGKKKSMLKYALARLSCVKSAVVFVALATCISSILGIFTQTLSKVFVDRIIGQSYNKWTVAFLVILSGALLIEIILAWINAACNMRINGKISTVGSSTFLWRVLHMPMDFFSQRMTGDIQMRMNTNGDIANQMVNIFAPLGIKTIMLFFYLAVMVKYSPLLTVVGCLSIFINLFVSRIISNKRINTTRVMARDSAKMSSTTLSGIDMIETIKASGAENGFFAKWSGYQAGVNAAQVEYSKIDYRWGVIPTIVSALSDIIIMYLGAILIMNGEYTIGAFVAFQGFLVSFSEPALTLISTGQQIQELRTDMERIEDVMQYPIDYENEDPLDDSKEYSKLKGNISIKNLSFGYAKLEPPIIKNFNLELAAGKSVALVGSSGSGKSTIAKLVSGLYRPWEGTIHFDGQSIDEINKAVFRGSVAVVDQDITLFEDTISNNIRMWDKSIEDFEIILAARDAKVHEAISKRPGGYNSMMAEGGKDFSGGERQRLELARVLSQDPTIIILDEATSALDAKTEFEVINAIKDRGITCIVVAHRLSTIRYCDEIIVLKDGETIERGTHDELYTANGFYTELVSNE
ncbi:MAG: NHLP family bacteriocin export ABC transporter peptidase/permease/ATPase subunit [Lachnospiraceae bacterium]|nr:NHLP family bacteriocin export ABC transporter peptidase/permease/ATPase subunit [Candidatus Colinaster equi]